MPPKQDCIFSLGAVSAKLDDLEAEVVCLKKVDPVTSSEFNSTFKKFDMNVCFC
mgnify:CR=1 FL=1